jgi:hypothetical protein
VLRSVAALDELLAAHESALGQDLAAYRNHAYRVVNLCAALAPASAHPLEKLAVAAAYHDLGIWTDRTFDYLPPSVEHAHAYLTRRGRPEWIPEIGATILEHHKLSRYRGPAGGLVEPFRRADWVDVTRGLVTFGLARSLVREVFDAWPSRLLKNAAEAAFWG